MILKIIIKTRFFWFLILIYSLHKLNTFPPKNVSGSWEVNHCQKKNHNSFSVLAFTYWGVLTTLLCRAKVDFSLVVVYFIDIELSPILWCYRQMGIFLSGILVTPVKPTQELLPSLNLLISHSRASKKRRFTVEKKPQKNNFVNAYL